MVANCHFHLDHCGGDPVFSGRPIVSCSLMTWWSGSQIRSTDSTEGDLVRPEIVKTSS